jgi:hypothetical protein
VNGAAERPAIGLFGAFDTGELGEVALRRVLESELTRRRPDIDLVVLAPFGAERPLPSDEGRPARPLERIANADSLGLDALIIAGDVLGDDQRWAARYPVPDEAMTDRGVATLALSGTRGGADAAPSVTWFAVGSTGGDPDLAALEGKDVWARDPATQERLGGTAVQSGDPVLLAGGLFPPEMLRRRADLLRLCGAIPAGRRVVVEVESGHIGSAPAAEIVEVISAALRTDPKLSVVVVSLAPTWQPSTDSILHVPGLSAERVHHLPSWVGLDDVAAAMAGSAAVIATSPAGAHLAASLSTPVSALAARLGHRFDPAIPILADDLPTAVAALLMARPQVTTEDAARTLDGALAELAERLPNATGSPRPVVAPDDAGSALAILQQRLVDERTALQAELSRVQAELDHLRASPEHRLARPIRELYQRRQRRRT